jgi:hypothetical protein
VRLEPNFCIFLRESNSSPRPHHGSGCWSPASHRRGPGSILGRSIWDLWWTKWHWDRFPPVNFILPVLHYKEKRIFITGLHNKPSRLRCVRSICCGALHHTKEKCHTRYTYIAHLVLIPLRTSPLSSLPHLILTENLGVTSPN